MVNRIVFYDADGTVIKRNYIRKEVMEAMHALADHDVLPVLSTGRSFPSIKHSALSQFDLHTMISAAGGAVIIDDQLVSHDYLTREHLQMILEYFDAYHLIYTLECNDALYMYPASKEKYFRRFSAPEHAADDEKKKLEERARNFARQLKLTNDPLSLHVNKIHWYGEPIMYDDGRVPLSFEEISEKFGTSFNVNPLSFRPGAEGGEINEKAITKQKGMAIIMDHYGIDRDHTYAIGDGENDIEMLKYAGHPIAMGNAKDVVKSIAEYVTDDIDHCGFVTAMKHYRLI